jgi:hypothetical protein
MQECDDCVIEANNLTKVYKMGTVKCMPRGFTMSLRQCGRYYGQREIHFNEYDRLSGPISYYG